MPTNSPKTSSSPQQQRQHSDDADSFGGGVEHFKQRLADWYSQIEGQTRETPSRSLLYALGAGYVLARLPVFGIVFSLFRLALMALKPAVLVYLGTLAYRRIMESSER